MTITRGARRRITGTVAAATAALGLCAAATPAGAATPAAPASVPAAAPVAGTLAWTGGCYYPQLCLYRGGQLTRPAGRFVRVTTGWQWLGRSFGARSFVNTRHDDTAYIKTTSGQVICVRPRGVARLLNGGATAVRISSRPTCR
jgi:hypothetical protein